MFDPSLILGALALAVAGFAGGRVFERWNAPEAARARLIEAARALVKKAETVSPDLAARAAAEAHAAQVVADLKAEVAKLP